MTAIKKLHKAIVMLQFLQEESSGVNQIEFSETLQNI